MKWLTKLFSKETLREALADVAPPSVPPPGVHVIDGHWWSYQGRENLSHLPMIQRREPRDVWECRRCDLEATSHGGPPPAPFCDGKRS